MDVECRVSARESVWTGELVLDERVEDLANIEQRPWEALVVHPDGRTVDVYFTDTDPDCTWLYDVEVATQPSGLEVVVLTGEPPDVVTCNERGGVFYVVTIDVEQALMGGGAAAQRRCFVPSHLGPRTGAARSLSGPRPFRQSVESSPRLEGHCHG